MATDKDLFESANKGNAEDGARLHQQVLRRVERDVQQICERLVGMGHCTKSCPARCSEFNTIGLDLATKTIEKAIKKPVFGETGYLVMVINDDDFRRQWNKVRNFVQEPINNKLLRTKAGTLQPTPYGVRFAANAKGDVTLSKVTDDDLLLLKFAHSWLNNLWDDACDNAQMSVSAPGEGNLEHRYAHPVDYSPDRTQRRYGFRADRIHRRRTTGELEQAIDGVLPKELQLKGRQDSVEEKVANAQYADQLARVSAVCEALLRVVEATDEPGERFQPLMREVSDDQRDELAQRNISTKVGTHGLEISTDDVDRVQDGIVDEKNPKTLFDDFSEAWSVTRGGHREKDTELPQYLDPLLASTPDSGPDAGGG
ncbi:MAG: hypothetical protein O3B45_08575 [Bacteroidetes bacterium]|nr:hypothetical protein [Bacteroidota bacterium]